MYFFLRFVLAALLANGVSTAFADAFDISGVSVGTPFSSARAAILKVNPAFKIEEFTLRGNIGLKAIVKQKRLTADYFVVLSNDAGIIWFVGREQKYATESRFSLDELDSALLQKYGEPTRKSDRSTASSKLWERYRSGRIHDYKHLAGPCDLGSSTNINGSYIFVPTRFNEACGIFIKSEARASTNDMVYRLNTIIVDSRLMFYEWRAKEAAAQQEMERRLQQEKLNRIKPML